MNNKRSCAWFLSLTIAALLVAVFCATTPQSALAYVEAPHSLGLVIQLSTNVMILRVEKVDKQNNVVFYRKVTDLKGKPLAGVPVDVWHADDDGFYDSQKPSYATQGPSSRARFVTDADGKFFFRTILPCSYPIPTDGPVGEMILQTRRHPMRPAHVHFLVNAPGYEPLITHVFIDGDKYLDTDVVFGVKDELVAKIEKRSDPKMPDGKPASAPWHLMTYEFHMKPGGGDAPKPMAAKATEDA